MTATQRDYRICRDDGANSALVRGDDDGVCHDPLMIAAQGLAIAAMVIASELLRRALTTEPSELTRVMRAYRAAWTERAAAGETGLGTERLIAEMKAKNVPGIYTEPFRPLIHRAVQCWKAGVDPRHTRRALKSVK